MVLLLGVVETCRCGQYKCTICSASGQFLVLRRRKKDSFHHFQLAFLLAIVMLESSDLAIFASTDRQREKWTKPITLSLAHAHRQRYQEDSYSIGLMTCTTSCNIGVSTLIGTGSSRGEVTDYRQFMSTANKVWHSLLKCGDTVSMHNSH